MCLRCLIGLHLWGDGPFTCCYSQSKSHNSCSESWVWEQGRWLLHWQVKGSQTAPLWLEPKDGEHPFEEGALEAGFQIKSHHSPESPGKFNGQFFTKSAHLYKINLFIFSLFNTIAENPSDHNKLSGCFCEKGGWTTTKLLSSFNVDSHI